MSVASINYTLDGTTYSLTTYTITESSVETVTYFDSDFNTVGTKVTNADGDITFNIKLPVTGGFVEEGYYRESGDSVGATYKYNYNSSSEFTGGTETQDDVTTTYDASWAVTGEAFTGSLGTALATEVKDALAPAVLASTGETYATTGSDGETVYRNADKAVTGYKYDWSDGSLSGSTYFDASDNWVGDTFTDGLLETSNFITTTASGRTETGSYAEKDSGGSTLFSRTFTYNYDTDGNFTGGTETVDGETTTYGANWAVEGKSVSAASLTTASAASGIPDSFVVSGNTHTITETFGNDSEITYYNADGTAVLGRQLSFSYESGATTGATFVDSDWNWIGDTFSDGTWTSRRFETDNGNGTKTETGFESDGTGWSREWIFVFDSSNGNFLSGTETQNGITTTFGENWQIEGKSADTSSLGTLDDADVLSELPSSFILTNSDSESYALYKLIENDWGDETTYFDAEGEILGYAFGWNDGAGSSGTSFNDADWNFLGDVYISSDGFKNVRFETDNGDGTRTEIGAEYIKNTSTNQWDLERSWTFKFDNSFNLIEGTETRDGITTEFGAGWNVLGESVDVSSASLTAITDLDVVVAGDIKLSDLYNFTASVNGASVTAGYYSSEVSTWGDSGTEYTYFNAAGAIVGRKSEYSFTFTDHESNSVTQTGETYFGADGDWIGDIFDDSNWSGSRFELDLEGGGRREIGSEADSYSGWSRSFDYTFGSDGNLVSGSEVENGVTTTYGANWEVTGRKADLTGATTVTAAADLAELPASFKIGGTSAKYTQKDFDWGGSERTYFDADGAILGYAFTWDDGWASGTSFNDADWQFLGDIFISGDGYKNVRFETDNGDGTRTETGAEYQSDGSGGWTLLRSWEFNFDGYDMIGGTETRADGVEVEFDAGWIVKAEKVSVTNLDPIADLTAKVSAKASVSFSDLFDFSVEGVAAPTGYSKSQTFDHGSETVYYNQNGEVVGRAETFTHGEGESGTQYFDNDWMWIGEVFTMGSDSRTIFTLENADGSYTEYGSETFGGQSRSWEFNFSSNWEFLGGTEVENGISREVNAQGKVTNQTLDLDSVTLLTSTDTSVLAELPDLYKFGDPAQISYIEQSYPGGTETLYFDGANAPLGRSTSWTDSMHGGSGTDFFDADDEFIGNIFQDNYFKQVRFETKTKDADGNVTAIVETGAEYEASGTAEGGNIIWNEVRSFTFNFDGAYNLQSGTEKFDGVTTNFTAGWQVDSKSITIDDSFTAITAADAEAVVLLDLGLTGAATDIENGIVNLDDLFDFTGGGYYKDSSLTWGSGTERTYFDSAGGIIGRRVEESFSGQSFTQYFDEDWMWLGETVEDTFSGGDFTRNFFKVEKVGGGYFEVNSEVERDTSGDPAVETFSRKSVFEFASDGAFEGGREIDNGISFDIGSDWSRDQQARTDLGSLELAEDSGSYDLPVDFDDLPDSFKFDTDSDSTLDSVFREVVYSQGTDKQIDYYNASGEKIGDSFTFLDYSGETVTSYMDANYNWIGEVREEASVRKEVYTRSDAEVTVGGQIQIHTTEARTIYTWDSTSSPADWKVEASENFVFGPNGLVSGTEIRDGTTTVYGANFSIVSVTGDTNSLASTNAATTLLQGSATLHLDDIFDFGGATAYFKSETFTDPYRSGATFEDITYYKTGGIIVGYAKLDTFTYGDEVSVNVFYEDTSHNSLYNANTTIDTQGTVSTADDTTEYSYARYSIDNGNDTYSEIEVEVTPTLNRESTFTYSSIDDTPVSGSEVENGVTTPLQVVDGMFVRQAAQVDLSGGESALASLGITKIEGDALDELPQQFQFGAVDSEKAYRKTIEDGANFKEYHFFAEDGTQLGKAFVNIDGTRTETHFQDSSMPYPEYLGRTEVFADTSKFVSFETRSQETIDSVLTNIMEENGINYTWDGSDWQETSSFYYKFKETGEYMLDLLEGYQINGTMKTIYGANWSITGTEYYGAGAGGGGPAIGTITIPFLIESAPADWNQGGLEAVLQPDVGADARWDFAGQVSYYLSNNFIGTADAQIEYNVTGVPTSGVKEGHITLYDPDGNMIGYSDINAYPDGSSYQNSFVESKIPEGGMLYGREEVQTSINIDAEGRSDEYIRVDKYDSSEVFLGYSETQYDYTLGRSVTKHYDGNYVEIVGDRNTAPTTTAFAGTDAPEGVVGSLIEDDATTTASGSLSGYFTDLEGDAVSVSLLRPNSESGDSQVKEGQYGTLSFNKATKAWTYTIDNSKTQILVDGQTEHDEFVIEIQDSDGYGGYNHLAYYDLKVAIDGADDGYITTYNPGVHGGLTLKEYVLDGFSLEVEAIEEGGPTDGIASAAAMKIIGSSDLEISAETVGEEQALLATKGKIFDILVSDNPADLESFVSVAADIDHIQLSISVSDTELGVGTIFEAVVPQEMGSPYADVYAFYVDGDTLGVPTQTEVGVLFASEPTDFVGTLVFGGNNSDNVVENSFSNVNSLPITIAKKFSIDLADPEPISLMSGTLMTAVTNADITLDHDTLNVAEIAVSTTEVNSAIDSGMLGLAVVLDEFAQFSRPYTQEITVTIRDVIGSPDGTLGAGEREISAKADVTVAADGTDATVSFYTGDMLSVDYTLGDGSGPVGGPITFVNSANRMLSFDDTSSSVYVNFGQFLSDLGSIIDLNMLDDEGVYEYEISGLSGFLDELPGMPMHPDAHWDYNSNGFWDAGEMAAYEAANTPQPTDIDAIVGTIKVAPPTAAQKFDVNFGTPPVVTLGSTPISTNGTVVGDVLTLQSVDLDSSTIQGAIDGNQFGLTFNLDQVADLSLTQKQITVTVRDIVEGGSNTPEDRNNGEREITASFKVDIDGNGTTASITNVAGSKLLGSYTLGDGSFGGSIDKTNTSGSFISVDTGNSTLNVNIASLLDQVSDVISNTMLTQQGKYAYEITGLEDFLAEAGSSISTVKGEFNVTSTPSNERPFSIDTAAGSEPEIYFAGTTEEATLTFDKAHQTLNVSTLNVTKDEITSVIGSGDIGVSFNLDQTAKYNALAPQTITVKVRDVVGSPDGSRTHGERELTAVFDLSISADGTDAMIKSAADSALTLNYFDSNGNPGAQVVYTNLDEDVISLSGSSSNLNFDIGSILQKISGQIDSDMLKGVGTYEYEVSGLGTILTEGTGADAGPVNKIQGLINVSDGVGGEQLFSVDINPNNKSIVNLDGFEQPLDLSVSGDTISVGHVMLDSMSVTDVLETGDLGVSIKLDQMADFASPKTSQITIKVRDQKEGDIGEREISATFNLTVEGDGSSASVKSAAGSTMTVNYVQSDGTHQGPITYTNEDPDIVSLNGVNSSFNFNIGSILEKASGLLTDELLMQPGRYEYEVSGLNKFLVEGATAISKVQGTLEVEPGIDIQGGAISFDPDGNPGTVNRETVDFMDLIDSDVINLKANLVNSLGDPSFKLAPELSLKVGSNFIELPEGVTTSTEDFRIEIIEINEGEGFAPEVRDAAERYVSLDFELTLGKSGSDYTITAPTQDMNWQIITSSDANVIGAISNGDSDMLTLTPDAMVNVSNLNVKFDSILEKIDTALTGKGLSIPDVTNGDKFAINLSTYDADATQWEPMVELAINISDDPLIPDIT